MAPSQWSSRCSGATTFTASTAASRPSATTITPRSSRLARVMSSRGLWETRRSAAASTRPGRSASQVTR